MTQMKRAFEAAIKEAALKSFRTVFSNSLSEALERSFLVEVAKYNFQEVTEKNINTLVPNKEMATLAKCVETATEALFHEACFKARIKAFSSTQGLFGKKTLERMSDESFRPVASEVIAEFLSLKGSPGPVIVTLEKIFEAFFAKALLSLLIKKAPEEKQRGFVSFIDEMSNKAVDKALFRIHELSQEETYQPFRDIFAPTFTRELILLYKGENRNAALARVRKKVLNAFIKN